MSKPETLCDRLRDRARAEPGRPAVVTPSTQLDRAALLARVEGRARDLAAAGVDGSAVVAVACADDLAHLELTLALAELGATSCTLPSHESPEQNARLIERIGAHFVARASGVERVAAAGGARDAAIDPSRGTHLLFTTSGTTGTPKIVVHTDAGLVAQAHRHAREDERFCCLAAFEHNFVKRHRLYCVAVGATSVFVDERTADRVVALRALEVTTLHLSAFQAQELLALPDARSLAGLRLKLGGSHVPVELRERLRDGVTAHLECGYGTTETGAIAFTDPDDAQAADSVGRALPGIEVRVVDEQRRPRATGESGEVAIRGAGAFVGYLGAPEETARRCTDGWFHTGDVGRLDDAGRLFLGGRTDDVFVFNSMNVHPQELEACVRAHPAVRDAVVVPQHSPVHGDVPVALVVVEPDTDLRALKSFVRGRTGVRCPKRFVAIERVPRNDAGKVLRDEARALLDAGARS